MDYETIAKAGSRLGTGLITVVAHDQSIVSAVRNLEEFFARESCGWCTPCRDGLPWSVKILRAFEAGRGRAEDLEVLSNMTRWLGPGKNVLPAGARRDGAAAVGAEVLPAEFVAGLAPAETPTHALTAAAGS